MPQQMLGRFLVLIFNAKRDTYYNKKVYVWKFTSAISLGDTIIVNKDASDFRVGHEYGHNKQSKYLGWLYLIIIGLPSILWATLKRIGLFKNKNYYWFYTEKWANNIAGYEVYIEDGISYYRIK